ncbi:MAG: hypothetical protein DSY43_04475 [Gammaproteobacteria bacterium]|nr:MAG: hypothetical protein DSY43_04475 [Gammaproteobacteria bacterium]
MKKTLVFIILTSFLFVGCTPTKAPNIFSKRNEVVHAAIEATKNQKTGETLANVVNTYKDKFNKSNDLTDFVDYQYIKFSSISNLEKLANLSAQNNNIKDTIRFLEEIIQIDPSSQKHILTLNRLKGTDKATKIALELSPFSKNGVIINEKFFRHALFFAGNKPKQLRSLDDFTDYNSSVYTKVINKLFIPYQEIAKNKHNTDLNKKKKLNQSKITSKKAFKNTKNDSRSTSKSTSYGRITLNYRTGETKRKKKETITLPEYEKPVLNKSNEAVPIKDVYNVLSHEFGYHIVTHKSASRVLNDPKATIKINSDMLVIDVLSQIATQNHINFVFNQDKVYVYGTEEIPLDLNNKRSVHVIRSEFQDIESSFIALEASGFGGNISGLDLNSNVIWFHGNDGEYLRALLIVAVSDSHSAEVIVDIEIVEVESSFLSNIGLRIPHLVELSLSNPTYRKYSTYGGGEIGNNGVIVSNAIVNSANLTNILKQKTSDVLKATINDPAFRLAMQEKNERIQIIEKPTLRVRHGTESTIDVGNKVPVFTTTVNSNGVIKESPSYLSTGVKVKVKADILSNNEVRLDLDISILNYVRDIVTERGTRKALLGNRDIKTILTVSDGDTSIIGSLTSTSNNKNNDTFPGMSNSEFGFLGGEMGNNQHNSELLVFVTPRIVRPRGMPSRASIQTTGGRSFNAKSIKQLKKDIKEFKRSRDKKSRYSRR